MESVTLRQAFNAAARERESLAPAKETLLVACPYTKPPHP
jgi:hypothetical protein